MVTDQTFLKISDLLIGYKLGRNQVKTIAGPLQLSLGQGQLICLLGPNGCGKSTLIRTIAGLQPALKGSIILQHENLLQMKAPELATKLSLVLTDKVRSGNLDVYALVALGRYPYSGWLGILNDLDKAIIAKAMEATGITAFAARKMDSLSDGEAQKVMLARAIAQDTPFIILDEPTAHLDLPSRIQLMRLLHQLCRETNKTILISTHELDLALQVADQLWLMTSDGKLQAGMPEELILNGSFQQAFERDGISFDAAKGSFNLYQNSNRIVQVLGEGIPAFWTRKALLRKGFELAETADANYPLLRVLSKGQQTEWLLEYGGKINSHSSLTELMTAVDQQSQF